MEGDGKFSATRGLTFPNSQKELQGGGMFHMTLEELGGEG